jgi:hypothetical protein
VVPPDAASFQRLVDTADRVELTVSLRF